jgi:hypothetical protein
MNGTFVTETGLPFLYIVGLFCSFRAGSRFFLYIRYLISIYPVAWHLMHIIPFLIVLIVYFSRSYKYMQPGLTIVDEALQLLLKIAGSC